MTHKNEFSAVVACSLNYCIGKNNSLPWPHLKDDLKWLSQVTTASTTKNAVIMGRLTWDSLPKQPLKDRINIIVSRTLDQSSITATDTFVANSFENALKVAHSKTNDKVFCLGGAQLYSIAFNHPDCRYIFLSRINCVVDGDAFLNPKQFSGFKKLSDKEFLQVIPYVNVDSICNKDIYFNFECWERVK